MMLHRLEVDHQFNLGGLFDRQVGRPLALENSGGVDAELPSGIRRTRPVTDEPASGDEFAIAVDRGKRMPRRESDELIDPTIEKWIGANNHGVHALLSKLAVGCIELAGGTGIEYFQSKLSAARRRL